MIKTTRIKYSQAPRIIVDDLSPQCDGVKQTFTLSRPVPEWAPYCLVFNGQLYTNTAYKQWFVLDDDRKTIHTSFITPPTKGPNKSLILIVGVAGMEDLAVDWDDIVNKPEIPTEEELSAETDARIAADEALRADIPQVVQTTGTSTSKVMSQNATSKLIYQNPTTKKTININGRTTYDYDGAIQIGASSLASEDNIIAIGNNAQSNEGADCTDAVIIGHSANGGGYKSVTIGSEAECDGDNSVAIGDGSRTGFSDDYVVSFGDAPNEYTHYAGFTRRIVNITDPVDTQDAATKHYVDGSVSGAIGNLATVATSGSYNDLSNKPTIPAAQVNSDWNASSGKAQILNRPTLATVATSGSYNDLSNKPTIPAAQVNSDWNASSGKAQILNKPTLATVATSGSYNDLTNKPTIPSGQIQSDWNQTNTSEVDFIKNKPTIPTVNNATLTITQNGTSVGTFTANASSNKTIAVTDTTYSDATTSASGLMSASDKTKLNGIATGAEVNVQSDWNQATTTADDYIKNKPTLAAVATSGDYADLSGTPSIPTFTLQNTDPGEGGTLAANSFIGVYQ